MKQDIKIEKKIILYNIVTPASLWGIIVITLSWIRYMGIEYTQHHNSGIEHIKYLQSEYTVLENQ